MMRDEQMVHPGVVARIAEMEKNFQDLERTHAMSVGEFQDLLDVLKAELEEEREAHFKARKEEEEAKILALKESLAKDEARRLAEIERER